MDIYPLLLLLCITSGLSAMHKSAEHYQSVGYYRQSAEQRVPSLRFLAAQQLYHSKALEKIDVNYQQIANELLQDNVLHMRKDIAQMYANQECLAMQVSNNPSSKRGVCDKIRIFNLLSTINS